MKPMDLDFADEVLAAKGEAVDKAEACLEGAVGAAVQVDVGCPVAP
jgi:hypothetical protein